MKGSVDVIKESLKYENLNKDEKIRYIKDVFNLSHGKGKRKKKKK